MNSTDHCARCGREPTAASNGELTNGYCLVCWDRRQVKAQAARVWAVYRQQAIHSGEW